MNWTQRDAAKTEVVGDVGFASFSNRHNIVLQWKLSGAVPCMMIAVNNNAMCVEQSAPAL